MLIILSLLISCNYNYVCTQSKSRLKNIRDQRIVLLELNKLGKIGNKKFRTIDGILADEEQIEKNKVELRCGNNEKF